MSGRQTSTYVSVGTDRSLGLICLFCLTLQCGTSVSPSGNERNYTDTYLWSHIGSDMLPSCPITTLVRIFNYYYSSSTAVANTTTIIITIITIIMCEFFLLHPWYRAHLMRSHVSAHRWPTVTPFLVRSRMRDLNAVGAHVSAYHMRDHRSFHPKTSRERRSVAQR